MNCKNCGTELKEGAKFCATCGTAVEEAPVEVIAEPVAETVPETEPVAVPEEQVSPEVEPTPAPTPVAAPYVSPVTQPVATPTYAEPKRQKKITEEDLPEHLRPISPWAYFGLSLLYSVPIVGFVFLIVFSISRGNINRRNFTRSYWCSLVIVGAILVIGLVIGILTGIQVFNMRSDGGSVMTGF